MSSKAVLLCFILAGFVTTFKLLYKESIDTVNKPLIKHPITQSGDNGVTTSPLFPVIMAKVRTILGVSLCRGPVEEF